MSARNRAVCPLCRRSVSLFAAGDFRTHGPNSTPCIASRRTPAQAEQYILPPLNGRQLDLMRHCYRVGDWHPVEREFGIEFPQWALYGSTPEEELADLIALVRNWIETLICLADTRVRAS